MNSGGLRSAITRLIKAIQAPSPPADDGLRESIVLQLRSPHRALAQQALKTALERGWVRDGTLCGSNMIGVSFYRYDLNHANLREAVLAEAKLAGVNLFNANLHQADLRGANLTGAVLNSANLTNANLEGTYFIESDLRGADLRGAWMVGARFGNADLYGAKLNDWQVIHAEVLCGAVMPNGARYDGRLRLRGDLELASFLGINLKATADMAAFYNVPHETYVEGQLWADRYLDRLRLDVAQRYQS
ncbi:MAG: pentapeptide repeat-containing protein [Anaerolineae bacterium]